jgi:biopolymer transport protein TolR
VAKRGLGRSGVVAEINVTPMADVMLVLLIIFMITTPLLQSGITVNLPKAKNPLDAPEADSKEAVVVAVNREGKLYLAKKQIGEQDLYDFLLEKSTGPST